MNPLTAGELFTSNLIFSTYWQFSAKFTRNGGLLKPEDSDVMLLVPEEAVDIPSDIPTYDQSDATERILSDTESPVDQKSQVVPDIAEAVDIKMAVSTDLERAKKDLKLAETEQIVSPVAEFYAGKDFIFAKQVCISLPHFLPVGFDENQVKVYHVHRDASSRLLVQTIPKWTADSTGDSENFYMFREQKIQVMTSHFCGVLCSYCSQHETPPHLKLRLYGKQTKRKRMEVDLKLLVWDQKLSIRDFRKLALPDAKEESTLTSERVLNPVLDASRVELGVQLDMRQEDTDEWEHKFLNSKFPNTRREELTSLLACGRAAVGSTNQGPIVIDWAFQHRDQSDRSDDKWFSCTIDVGYVKEEEEGRDDNAVSALQFLPKPKKLTLPVNDLKQSDTAQHSAHGSGRSTPIPTMVFHNVKNVGIASSHNVSHSNPEDTELTERKTLDSSPGSASNEQSLDAQLSGMELTEGAAENPDRRAPAGTREFRTPTQDTQSEQPTHSNESEENA
ncbi:uncharacterized protein [Littorina saxatilis]|uniref:Uncharacterized protein n=1 Tax=Littorina saxatilis TaxID=31220 RepID=A0AAN9AJZ2_9CAEN